MDGNGATAPFVSRFYTSPDGLKLHYRDYAGPPDAPFTVLCIPGLTRNARDFDELAPHLAEKYRVICAELRGRGLSEYAKDHSSYVVPTYVRDIAALIKSAGLPHVAIIGTSLGGIVGTVFSSIKPQQVLGLALNDIGPEINPVGVARIAGYLGKTKPINTWDDAAEAMKMLDAVIYPDYQQADWLKMARRRFVQDPNGAFRPDYDLNISKAFGGAAVNLWPFFSALKNIPVMAIRGATSDLLAPEVFGRMKAVLPQLKQITVPNRGHAPYLDEAEAVQGIDAFLAALPTSIGFFTKLKRGLGALAFMVRLKVTGVI